MHILKHIVKRVKKSITPFREKLEFSRISKLKPTRQEQAKVSAVGSASQHSLCVLEPFNLGCASLLAECEVVQDEVT